MESDYLDTQFDAGFSDLRWLPWVGSAFATSPKRTMVLGESIYDYSEGRAAKRERIEDRNSLRERQLVHGIHETYRSKYLRNFGKAYYLKDKVSKAEREVLWRQMAYHNLVLRMMDSVKERPRRSDYLHGWKSLIELAQSLALQRCVVYGLDPVKLAALRDLLDQPGAPVLVERKRLPVIGRSKPLRMTLELRGGQSLALLFIRHPSAYFSWDKWGVVLGEFLGVS
ncbi:hypothetical protein [Duganella radicis]|uniref:Uncharacterized protein n=1 Tax=Duganella radicis TaxID=551988 RepID=A0A6L6PI84_9BURK|nr:hypothetical protein [Duganella radicis]MTV38261.1 hypothetical protein [Duganella radicis]